MLTKDLFVFQEQLGQIIKAGLLLSKATDVHTLENKIFEQLAQSNGEKATDNSKVHIDRILSRKSNRRYSILGRLK